MSHRSGIGFAVLAALAVGLVVGGHVTPSASAGPTVVGGEPTHWVITNSENGRTIYIWAVTNGVVSLVSENWVDGNRYDPEHPPALNSVEIQRTAEPAKERK